MIYIDAVKLFGLVADLDMTMVEFCTTARISTRTWQKIMEHGGPVKLRTLSRIAKAVNQSAKDLLLPMHNANGSIYRA